MIGGRRNIRNRWRLGWLLVPGVLVVLPLLPDLLATSEEEPQAADAIYVFPGGVPERAECAATLYRRGLAPRVVFSGGRVASELVAVGQPLADASLNALVARTRGVPAAAEVVLDRGSSTWEDAEVLGSWMRQSGARRVIAVTSPTHSRRALYTLRFALGDLAGGVGIHWCGPADGPLWWTRERPLVRVTLEALKFGFYGVRFFLPAALGFRPVGPPA